MIKRAPLELPPEVARRLFEDHPSEISIAGTGDFQYIVGEMTPILAPVPEPSTWAMMIVGFASVGFMACRERGRGRTD
jgi:hypothetical protein